MSFDGLDHHLVSNEPAPIYMGELPSDYGAVPARVIVNVCGVFPRIAPLGYTLFAFPMQDSLDDALVPPREELERFVDAVHAYAADVATYWHCHAGLNRSGLVLATYLHRHRGLTISDAIDSLRRRRSGMVLCNSTFERVLRQRYGTVAEQTFAPVALETWLRERVGGRGLQ